MQPGAITENIICFIICMLFITFIIKNCSKSDIFKNKVQLDTEKHPVPLWRHSVDFDKFEISNETGTPTGRYVVPNYVHYVHLGGQPISYVQMICILMVLKNQRPDKIVFHYENKKTFSGNYWKILYGISGFKNVTRFKSIEQPGDICGQHLNDAWQKWYASDIRIKLMMKYEGIYLDNDYYVAKRIDNYRRFEISMQWDEGGNLKTPVIIVHKDARYLKRWLECYKVYNEDKWYYNAVLRSVSEVLYKEPELLRRVEVVFGADATLMQEKWDDGKDFYIFHVLFKPQYLLKNLTKKATFPVAFNETNIANYPVTCRDMAYDLYDVANVTWPKKV